MPQAGPERCRRCGLEHVRKVTMDEMRMLIRVAGGPAPGPTAGTLRPGPFCLCACCPKNRGFAEWTLELARLAG
jgi:hypothetical protein